MRLQNLVVEAIKTPSLLAFGAVFIAGIIVSLGSCAIMELPILIGYIGGMGYSSRRRIFAITLLFVLGMLTTYLIIGIVIGMASMTLSKIATLSTILYLAMGTVSLILGLYMLGFIHPPIPNLSLQKPSRKLGLLGAYLLGLGFIFFEAPTCPACAPALMLISSYMVTAGKILWGLFLLLTYALGQSVPILIAGTLTSVIKPLTERAYSWKEYFQIVSSILLILVSLDLFWLA
ncbi:MAG: cytochrome c biogenesis protein CcdA [Actinomycetota bacterium]|nr:cytochrome c biogenesis protein CcdA [Actinomycetota bacterium]MDI6822653.1 cytochrome c biogenesis protein CcdA [Actinomycetota bacterium]